MAGRIRFLKSGKCRADGGAAKAPNQVPERGLECAYFHTPRGRTKDRGFKLFRCEESATLAFRDQRAAADCGLAPKVFGELFSGTMKNSSRYEVGKDPAQVWGYCTEHAPFVGYLQHEEQNTLVQGLKELGMTYCDTHGGNMGRLADGTPVMIDFGPISTGR